MFTTFFKKAVMTAAVAGTLGVSASAFAITGIQFDWTGNGGPVGGGVSIGLDRFNWVQTQALADETFATLAAAPPGTVDILDGYLYGQGRLGNAQLGGTIIGNAALNNFTYQFRVPVAATTTVGAFGPNALGTVVQFADQAVQSYGGDNYFRIFYSPAGVNETTGTGFGFSEGEAATAGQALILEGKVDINATAGSNFAITNGTLVPIGAAGTLTQGGVPIFSIGGSGSLNLNIEHCDADDGALAQCAGGPTTIDTNYFLSDIEGLTVDLNLGNGVQTPFTQQPVPARVVNQLPDFGGPAPGPQLLNNVSCEGAAPCDMLYQGQNAVTNFFGTFVPEPGTVGLLGLGLAALGFGSRRRKPLA